MFLSLPGVTSLDENQGGVAVVKETRRVRLGQRSEVALYPRRQRNSCAQHGRLGRGETMGGEGLEPPQQGRV